MAGVTAPIRVLVVDDDPLVRSGLTMMLDGADGISVVGEAADGDEVPAALDTHPTDVVLMDLRMPRVDGVRATARLRSRPNAPEVVVLTTFDSDEEILGALRAGASGFLLKDTPPPQISEALRRVAAGESILSPSVTRRLIDQAVGQSGVAEQARQRLARLSERELEVVRAIGQGRTNAEIAAQMYLSLATVKAHVSQVLTKLELTNRTQIALLAHDAGMA
ncbi:response regulator transcription factor [Georgenia halophila]|uniref:response regulator transcription factor n=1 Tax=Georgenia halophila TaxID=620889 RepID=UPI0031F07094